MPNRSLIAAAVTVWSVALLVGVLLGLTMLLTDMGVDVDAGLIVNALAAAGAFSAAAAAVWIATSDRRDRKHERDAADHAQARLVLLDVSPIPKTADM
jgi:membrane associated rhomboid family serine protease